MNRSVERRGFTTGALPSGELAAGWFDHPVRGVVRGSGAPLVAASLRRRGLRVREGFLPVLTGSGNTVMFTASYLDLDGTAVGFAVAARADDQEALTAASEAVDSWSAIWRTRRLFVADANPLCPGARRAVQLGEQHGGDAGYVVDDLRFPALESTALDSAEVAAVGDLAEVPPEDTVVFPAHGVPVSERREAAARGLTVLDMTCPLVRSMQQDIRRFTDRGDTVLLIGRGGNAVTAPLVGEAPGSVVVIESLEDVRKLQVDGEKLSYLISGGVVIEEVMPLIAALRARYPRLRGQHPDGLCYAASDRTKTVRSVSMLSDVMLVLGPTDSPDSGELADLVASCGVEVHQLADATEIRAEWLAAAATVGLVTAASAKPRLSEDVIEAVSGLGPLSVLRHADVTEIVKAR